MTLNGVGIVCALATEARHLGPAVEHRAAAAPTSAAAKFPTTVQVVTLRDGTLLAVSGMGGLAARAAAQALLDVGARALASWGMAGGLDPSLAAGDICLPEEVQGPDGSRVPTTPYWRHKLSAELMKHESVRHGRLVTVMRPVSSPAQKAVLFRLTGAVAVDMESAAVAEVARDRALPFIAVRVIVDSALDSLPRSVTAAADAAGQVHLWQLIGSLARAPADLAPTLRLARRYRSASRTLAAVARSGPLARHAFPAGPDTVHS